MLVLSLQGLILSLEALQLRVELAVRISENLYLCLEGHDLLLVSYDLRLRCSLLRFKPFDGHVLVFVLVQDALDIGLESLYLFLQFLFFFNSTLSNS